MNRYRKSGFLFLALVLVLAAAPPSVTAQIQIFSTGQYGTPETISLAPPGFGGTFGGTYLIPDARLTVVWSTPTTGGPPTQFLPPILGGVRGGTFLPTGWGDSNAGLFLTAGLNVNVYNGASLKESFLYQNPDDPFGPPITAASNFTTPLIAPAGFPTFGGHLFVSDQNNNIWRAAPGTIFLNKFGDLHASCPLNQQNENCPFWNFSPFGMEFSPISWGSFGDQVLLSGGGEAVHDDGTPFLDANGNRYAGIVALATDGTARVFTNIPLRDGVTPDLNQSGLRQMLLLPNDYLVPSLGADGAGQLVLVSVTGSGQGGGTLGETLAINAAGEIKGHLVTGSVTSKFDPRGMTLTADNHILVSDTADPIWKASPTDFAPGRGAVCSVISSVSTSSLWPPNHDLVNVGLTAASSCPAAVSVAVYSDEDDTADTGDGNFSPDAKGSTPATLRLRSERNGNGDGRVYLIVVKSTDSAGTVAPSCSTVVVPHSQSKKDKDSADAQAAAAKTFCQQHNGSAPSGFFVVGDGPVIGPKQ